MSTPTTTQKTPPSNPSQALLQAEGEFAAALAELHGVAAAIDGATEKLRLARAALDAAALPRVAGEEAWRDYCAQIYAELLAAPRIGGAQ
jgi:hypothetical protein